MIVLAQESSLELKAESKFQIKHLYFVLMGEVIPSAGFHICKMWMMTNYLCH